MTTHLIRCGCGAWQDVDDTDTAAEQFLGFMVAHRPHPVVTIYYAPLIDQTFAGLVDAVADILEAR